ncbi:hypothetical protein DPMN_189358 [Dreissena polymorpha]|uniref:Uncharacterized protein n=1 Tax=Dreissena polymorpha TaxID=45954 RepID=A0A9D4IC50_DREPO|nr:hypothetical protein DPMN_189358 [Dreissena polymorpha]
MYFLGIYIARCTLQRVQNTIRIANSLDPDETPCCKADECYDEPNYACPDDLCGGYTCNKPSDLNLKCRINDCGGCKRVWYIGNYDVKCLEEVNEYD